AEPTRLQGVGQPGARLHLLEADLGVGMDAMAELEQGVGFALQLDVDAAGEVGHTVAPFADARARRPAGTCRPAAGCPSHTAPSRGTVRDGAACGATRTNARGAQAERRRPKRRRPAWRPPAWRPPAWRPPARRPSPRNAGLRASWTQPPQFAADASTRSEEHTSELQSRENLV